MSVRVLDATRRTRPALKHHGRAMFPPIMDCPPPVRILRSVAFWLISALFLVSSASALAASGPVHAAAECRVDENEPGDDQLASIAKRVPAFGGFYVDGSALNVWLTDDGESLDAAVQEILSLPDHHGLADLTPTALPAQYSYTQLFCWQYGEMLEVESTLEYIYTGIDDARNRLTVAVEDLAKQGPAWRARLVEVGIPLEAVDIIEEEPIMLLPGPAESSMPRSEPFKPVPASQSSGGKLTGIAIVLVVAVGVFAAFFARRRMRRADQGLDREALLPRGR